MKGSLQDQLDQRQMKRIHRHVGVFIWFLLISLAGFILFFPLTRAERIHLALVLLVSIPYSLLIFFGWIPPGDKRPGLFQLMVAFSTVLIGWAHYILGPYNIHVDSFYAIAILFISLFGSWQGLILVTLMSMGINYLINTSLLEIHSSQYLIIQIYDAIGIGLIGIIGGFIGRTLKTFSMETFQKNRSLSMLVEANRITSSSADLDETLPELAQNIAEGLSATSCRIALLDHFKEELVNYGVYPLRELENFAGQVGRSLPLDQAPKHQEAIETGQSILINVEEEGDALADSERKALFFEGVKTICIVPIQQDGQVMGVLSVGEARSIKREPFPPGKVNLLSSLAKQTANTIQTSQLHRDLESQADRLSVLYDVSRAISRTIEIDDLLELIYEQLTRVIPSDAYFVALYMPEDDVLDLKMLIDSGQRYPPQKIPADQGLSSWIVEHRQALMIKNVAEEIDDLPIDPIVVGKEEVTPSWLGVPMIIEDELIGILAVASYQIHAFDESDQLLLEQIAQQAAFSINNARHHLEVEQQAQLDSLTQVYNHGAFIDILNREARQAQEDEKPLSLIMLDIDYFKQYNDTYGHMVGDEVLRLIVDAIQKHIKSTDSVGRWGGEEFGVVLPDANVEQAEMVANRIRKTLRDLPLEDTEGDPIPKPTISQGIATLPEHTDDVDELIVIADRALYQAKEKGRDQVLIAGGQASTPSPGARSGESPEDS